MKVISKKSILENATFVTFTNLFCKFIIIGIVSHTNLQTIFDYTYKIIYAPTDDLGDKKSLHCTHRAIHMQILTFISVVNHFAPIPYQF